MIIISRQRENIVIFGNTKLETKNKNPVARMDDTETIFVIKKTIKNTISGITAITGLIANRIPKPVATPLPPLNLSQIGNM